MFESISHFTNFITETYEQVKNYWKNSQEEEFDSIV
jgi:hypothetical protein